MPNRRSDAGRARAGPVLQRLITRGAPRRSHGERPLPRIRLRIGVDTGGTFTDFHASGEDGDLVFKVPSTPADPAGAVLEGLRRVFRSIRAARPFRDGEVSIVHGTTVGTNALLTRKGARTAFVTTAGFEDLIEIGRQNRESLYDLNADRPLPLVPRLLRFGLRERVFIAPGGSSPRTSPPAALRPPGYERVPPTARDLARLARRLAAAGVESVAVGLLHSYLNPANELRVGRVLAAAGLPVTLSHRIAREYREYERWQTAIANAFLQPVIGRYLSKLAAGARPARLAVLQSDGTTSTAGAAAIEPVRTVLSGPAGGALAALALARRLGDRRVLSFDMGGTSTDAVLIDGDLPRAGLGKVAGLPIRSPIIEVNTVGAGGGSIARRDAAGALRVGPESAGADPGPACYGRGMKPTVTDAHLVLGRLGEKDLLGGTFPVSARRARRAVGALARSLGLGRERAAEGILEVVEATMERALRAISIGRGKDPRRYALYAFGGAGGLHACGLAARLGIRRVVIPPSPGVFSATGLAGAAPGVETSATALASPGAERVLGPRFRALEAQALSSLEEQGIEPGRARLARFADLRYSGQSHEITVPYGPAMDRAFARAHLAQYGHIREGADLEVVTIRVRATLPAPRLRSGPTTENHESRPRARRVVASVPVILGGRRFACRVLARDAVAPRSRIAGPVRITEYSATTFIPPGWEGFAGPMGSLILTPLKKTSA